MFYFFIDFYYFVVRYVPASHIMKKVCVYSHEILSYQFSSYKWAISIWLNKLMVNRYFLTLFSRIGRNKANVSYDTQVIWTLMIVRLLTRHECDSIFYFFLQINYLLNFMTSIC